MCKKDRAYLRLVLCLIVYLRCLQRPASPTTTSGPTLENAGERGGRIVVRLRGHPGRECEEGNRENVLSACLSTSVRVRLYSLEYIVCDDERCLYARTDSDAQIRKSPCPLSPMLNERALDARKVSFCPGGIWYISGKMCDCHGLTKLYKFPRIGAAARISKLGSVS